MKRPLIPLIGITMDAGENDRMRINNDYVTSVERAGGLPLPIPFQVDHALIPSFVDLLDGVLFTGGNDLDPALFGETRHPKTEPLNEARQNFELALLKEVERRRTPALGICLGSQMMNVHRGGSLYQFLPDHPRDGAIEHRKLEIEYPRHPVHVDVSTMLGRALGREEVLANTYHKQAVRQLGRGLRVVATAPDGVIEGFEDPALPLFASVQWHPERLSHEPEHLRIFKLLVDKALEFRRPRQEA